MFYNKFIVNMILLLYYYTFYNDGAALYDGDDKIK